MVKSLLIAQEFIVDFVNECGLESALNLSLIPLNRLLEILRGFKQTEKPAQFPYKLLMRDAIIQEDRILKAILK